MKTINVRPYFVITHYDVATWRTLLLLRLFGRRKHFRTSRTLISHNEINDNNIESNDIVIIELLKNTKIVVNGHVETTLPSFLPIGFDYAYGYWENGKTRRHLSAVLSTEYKQHI